MPEPIRFFEDDPAVLLPQEIAAYEKIADRTLGNADPERLQVNGFILRLAQHCAQANTAANQNFVRFATGRALEEIGFKFGVFRLEPSAAKVVIRFTIAGTLGTVLIPEGTRVKSNDGKVLFATDEDVTSAAGTVDITCTCLKTGDVGNGYLANTIQNIVDPVPGGYVTAATNTETSTGGSDEETDDQLRERIPKANSTFSVAGPEDAYIYFAKTASADIVDVKPVTDVPGTVKLYVLLDGGVIPGAGVLTDVEAICSDKKVRPLTDTVVALAPTEVSFSIDVDLKVKKSAVSSVAVADEVAAVLNAFVNARKNRLGLDVVIDQYKGKCMSVSGTYSADITSLVADISIGNSEFAKCTGVTVNVVAVVDED